MGGYSCGSGNTETYTGSQWHRPPLWVNDPLYPSIQEPMSTVIPSGFGPVNPPYLTEVTQLAGTGFSSLAAIPTPTIPIPYAVDVLIANQPQRWFLVAGTTAGGAGIVIPNDYNATTNARYWVQLS